MPDKTGRIFTMGAKVRRTGRKTVGEVVYILPSGQFPIGVRWPGRRTAPAAFYNSGELEIVDALS